MAILVVAIFGILINAASLVFLYWRHKEAKKGAANGGSGSENGRRVRVQSTLFHHLLAVLAACDLLVVICCALTFGLPAVWSDYVTNIYPYVVPYLLPMTHIAVMASVYSTILIRYRILFQILLLKSLNSFHKLIPFFSASRGTFESATFANCAQASGSRIPISSTTSWPLSSVLSCSTYPSFSRSDQCFAPPHFTRRYAFQN